MDWGTGAFHVAGEQVWTAALAVLGCAYLSVPPLETDKLKLEL